MVNKGFIQMPNLKIPTFHLLFLSIIIFILHIKTSNTQCTFPFQRCICTSGTPFCPCSSITSTQTLNLTSSYFSHLVLLNGYGCRPCPPRCRRCSSLQICTDCFDEFELLNSLCEPCPINCKKCRLGVCQECIDEYYIDYQQKCQKCPLPGTKTCTIDSLRSCQSNYWLDNNGAQCVNCDANCRTCSSTTKCTRCMDGYFENNFQCSICRSDCRTCLNNLTCIDCKLEGYYFNTTQSACVPCPLANCQSCLSNGTCIMCSTDNGFYLDKSQRTCLAINSTKRLVSKNCRNLTYTQTAADYLCQLCKDGYYIMNDYSNVSQLQCYYGCSILCSKCTGAHYGLCDACVSDSDFTLVNRHCVPRLNLNDGTAFQYYYSALSNSSFFGAPKLILPDSCWHQHVKGGASSVVVRFSRLGVYKMKLVWKVYKYAFDSNNTFGSNQSYSVQINNSIVQKSLNSSSSYGSTMIAFTCQDRTGFSSMCTNGSLRQCIDKNQITFQGIITSDQNIITLSSPNSLIAISQLLVVSYRCGGLYGDGCIQCSDINTCTKCDNPNYYIIAEKCISKCPRSHYTFEEVKKCVEICPVGSYPDDSLHQCFSCQSPCETCNSLTECVTCREGFFYSKILLKCEITCPSRHYPDAYRRICERCTSPCLECVDNIKCISCRQGFLRLYNNQSSTPLIGDCVLQCPDGYYTDLTTMRCQSCSSPCSTCSMLTDSCTTCVSGYFLMTSKCLTQCPQGYYKDVTSSKCQRCPSSCQQCLNPTYCTQCQLGFYLTPNNTCISTCPLGFYSQEVMKKCLRCNQNCSTCKSETVCSTCVSGFSYLEEDYMCVQKCPQFYYSLVQLPGNLSVCSRCQLPCYDCSSQHYCMSCYDAFLFNGACVTVCPSGYYAHLASLTCLKCDLAQCVQCKNIPTQCTKCNSSLLLVNEKCLPSCPYGFYFSSYKAQCVLCSGLCSSCVNSTFCLSCIKGFVLENSTGLCLNTCPPGFYQVKDTTAGTFKCFPCDKNCQSCTYNLTVNKSQCIMCKSNYSLTMDSVCLSVCPDRFYSLFEKCQKCSPPCFTCVDEEYCLDCMDGFGYGYEGACVSQCPYGYYQTQSKCMKCDSTCLTCSQSATQCSVCQPNLFLLVQFTNTFTDISTAKYKSICVNKCPAVYVQVDPQQSTNYEQQCEKCALNCKTCGKDYEQCTSCQLGMILFQNRCIKRCPISHYINPTSNTCTPCTPTCQYCLNFTFCLNCQQGYSLTSNNQCVFSCAFGEYSSDRICRKCMYPCGNCTDADTCVSCLVGIFYDGGCIDQCPEGTYFVVRDGLEYCVRCKENCSRCLSETQCLFCEVGYLYRSMCMEQCPDGFFPNYGACMQCQQNCGKCENSYSCTLCTNNSLLFENKCIKACPIGYYQHSLDTNNNPLTMTTNPSPTCLPCSLQCSKCLNSSNQCMQCNKGYYLYIDKCISQCPQGTYEQAKFWVCEPCVSPCETCSNAYSCGTCVYGYLLYREAMRNQCVKGPTCPNNYYLNVDQSICQFECPVKYYISNSTKTCSTQCPSNLVTLQSTKSCLQVCPPTMWIDHSLTCQPQSTRPPNLPQLKCQPLQVRNLLFFKCWVDWQVVNMGELGVEDFRVSLGRVHDLMVRNNTHFYLLVLGVGRVVRSENVRVELVNKYKMFAVVAGGYGQVVDGTGVVGMQEGEGYYVDNSDNAQNNRSLQQSLNYTYPIQNHLISIYLAQYIPFTIQQRQVGMNFYQIGQAISYAALVLWFFSLVKNLKSTALLFIVNLQWLYGLSFLPINDSYPPNVNQFLESFKFSALVDIFGEIVELGEEKEGLWLLGEVKKDKFWAINDFYNFTNSLVAVYGIIGFFVAVYVILFSLKKFFEWMSKRALDKEKIQEEKRVKEKKQHNKQSINQSVKSLAQSQQIKSHSHKQISLKKQSLNEISSINQHKSSKRNSKTNHNKQQQKQQLSSVSKKSTSSQSQKPKPWSQIYMKMSKKSDILLQRFHYNYLYQLILLTSTAISLSTNIQLTQPTAIGLSQTTLIILIYIIFLTISFYFYYKSQTNPQYKSRKPLRSTAFFYINFIEILVQNAIIIWTSFYFFVGVGFVCIVVNIVAWNWIYRKSQAKMCAYLQLVQVVKGFVLVMLVVGSMKREKWDRDEVFMFGFGQMAVVFVLILLSAVGVGQELFSDQPGVKGAIKNNSSAKYEVLKKKLQQQGKHDEVNAEQQNHEDTSGFQDDPQFQSQQSFFSNKTPVESDSDSSQGDLIDFDQSVQSRKDGFGKNNNRSRGQGENPPKNLFRYGKNERDVEGVEGEEEEEE